MTHNGGHYQKNIVIRWGRAAAPSGDLFSSFCPLHHLKAHWDLYIWDKVEKGMYHYFRISSVSQGTYRRLHLGCNAAH